MTKTADPKWPEGYSIPWNISSAHQLEGLARKGWSLLRNWLGISQLVVRIVLCITCFAEVLLLSLLFVTVCCYCSYYIVLCIGFWTVFISIHEVVWGFFLILPSSPQESQQVPHVILSCQMGLDHNIWEGTHVTGCLNQERLNFVVWNLALKTEIQTYSSETNALRSKWVWLPKAALDTENSEGVKILL